MIEADQKQLRRASDRIAAEFESQDFLCAEAGARLVERLDFVTLEPGIVLDLGAATGRSIPLLEQRFPDAEVVQIDWSLGMLRAGSADERSRICADAQQLPFDDASVDIVFANLLLPACSDPERVCQEALRVLRHPGLFIFSTLGPDTLAELRRAWKHVDPHVHVHEHADMHNVGDALVRAGFCEPVLDVDVLTVNYRSVERLVGDLRGMAATNRAAGRPRGLTTPRRWRAFVDALPRDPDGRLPVSIELICGQAWTGEPSAGVRMDDGVASFPLSRLRRYRG